jgi:hypothetical protein
MLQRLQEQRDGPAMADDGDDHDAELVAEHPVIECQMESEAKDIEQQHRRKHQRSLKALGMDPPDGERTGQRRYLPDDRLRVSGTDVFHWGKQTACHSSRQVTIESSITR